MAVRPRESDTAIEPTMFVAAIHPAGLPWHRFRIRQIDPAAGTAHHQLRIVLGHAMAPAAGASSCMKHKQYDGTDDQCPKQELHVSPRCSTTSSTKRVPTYASNRVAKPVSVKRKAVLPRHPRQTRP